MDRRVCHLDAAHGPLALLVLCPLFLRVGVGRLWESTSANTSGQQEHGNEKRANDDMVEIIEAFHSHLIRMCPISPHISLGESLQQ